MSRYRWSLLKTLEFLNSRRPDLEIRATFIHQLTAYENRLVSQGIGPKTSKWTEVHDKTNKFENEELLLRNTYLNAQMGPFADFSATANEPGKQVKIKWVDTDSKQKILLATVIGAEETTSSANDEPEETSNKKQMQSKPIAAKPIIPKEEKNNIVKVVKKIVQKPGEYAPPRIKPESKQIPSKDRAAAQVDDSMKAAYLAKSSKGATKQIPIKEPVKPKYNNYVEAGK